MTSSTMFKNKCMSIDIVRLRWCHSMQSTLSSSCIQFYSKKWRGRFSKIFEDMLFLKKKFGKTLVLQSKFFTILNIFDRDILLKFMKRMNFLYFDVCKSELSINIFFQLPPYFVTKKCSNWNSSRKLLIQNLLGCY